MKRNVKTAVAVVLGSLVMSSVFSSFAMSELSSPQVKIAVVDVPSVVASSSDVNKLKEAQKVRISELTDFIKKAKADVDATKDSAQKKKLEDGYNKELNDRKQKIDKDYTTDLSKIEKDISSIITKKAKEANYQVVLSKGVVLYGGDDITADIKKAVK